MVFDKDENIAVVMSDCFRDLFSLGFLGNAYEACEVVRDRVIDDIHRDFRG